MAPFTVSTTLQRVRYVLLISIINIVITNEPQGNMIITASIGSDGNLVRLLSKSQVPSSITEHHSQRLDRAVSAGGRGLHGVTANGNTGTDGLFSQGSIQVSAKAGVLATVNVRVIIQNLCVTS